MKKRNSIFFLSLFLSVLTVTFAQGTIGSAQEGIPDDFENNLCLNTNFREMAPGETYQIIARRLPEIIDNGIDNNVVLPKFHYTVVRGTSVEVDENGLITANALGTSIIEVKYDEITAYETNFGAISPVNISYLAVDVIDPNVDTGITLSTDITTRSYDTHYFLESSVPFSFAVTAQAADELIVKCNDVVAELEGAVYTVNLENRDNIIEIVAKKGELTKKLYYVIAARKIEIKIENNSTPNKHFEKGDKAHISFKGITLPVYKLATIYNPQFESDWGGTLARVYYENDKLGKVNSNIGITQYDLAKYNTIELTLNDEGTYLFNDGHIFEAWWGSALGTEKDMTGPGQPNLDADVESDRFSFFPDFRINVGLVPANFEDISLSPESELYADASKLSQGQSVSMNLSSGSFSFKNTATNWGKITSWYGVAVSNRTDNVTAGGVSNQFNSAAGGDIDGTGNYAVVFDAYSVGGMGGDEMITFTNKDYPEGKIIEGLYITNNTYGTNSMKNGDKFAKKFGGATGNDPDFFTTTIKGWDKNNTETGSVVVYLADFRPENNIKDYILEDWRWVDLSPLGTVSKITFHTTSSDLGKHGMKTPAYFCVDNINLPRLMLKDSIKNVSVPKNSEAHTIDLSNVFSDPQNDNIEKSLVYNTNPELVNLSISANQLVLSFVPNKEGEAEISIKGKSNKMSAESVFKVKVGNTSGVNLPNVSEIVVYPNPANDYITLNHRGKVEIFALSGVKVKEIFNYEKGQNIDVSFLPKGVYLVRLTIKEGTSTTRLIKR